MRIRGIKQGPSLDKAAKLLKKPKAKRPGANKQRWRDPVRPTSKEKGDELEHRVAELFKRRGYSVELNVMIKSPAGHRSEIDVIAKSGLPWRRPWYIECKNYSKPLPLHSIAKFKEVLVQNQLPLSRGLLITTATLSPRVRAAGIRVWDGEELIRAEAQTARSRRLRAWLRVAAAAGGVYAAVILAAPAAASLQEDGWLPDVLSRPMGGPDAAGGMFGRSPLDLAIDQSRWWARAGAAAAGACSEAMPEEARKAAEELGEGASVLVRRVRRLVGAEE